MSLINQVLNDLEERRADTSGARLPRDVRPLPAVESRRGRVIAAGVAVIVAFAVAAWAWQVWGPGRPLPVVPGASVPALLGASMPPLAVPMPDPVSAAPVSAQDPAAANGTSAAVAPAVRPDGAPGLRLSSELSTVAISRSAPSAPQQVRTAPEPGVREGVTPALRSEPVLPATLVTPAAPAATPATESPEGASGVIEKQPVAASDRERAERLYRSALAQINLGRADDGLTILRAALREDPAHVAARQTLVRMYVDSRSWDAATGVLREGLERRPEQAAWAMLLSRLLIERGDNAGALQVLEKHEAAGRGNAPYLAGLAAVLQRVDRHADAAVRYEQASRLEPANGRWWLGLATAREVLGQSAEARDAYQRAAGSRNLPAELQAFAEAKLK